MLISRKDFGIGSKPYKTLLNTVNPEGKLKLRATKIEQNFVYNEASGQLHFNENGVEDGWGQGGLIADLDGAPQINKDNFLILNKNGKEVFERGGYYY